MSAQLQVEDLCSEWGRSPACRSVHRIATDHGDYVMGTTGKAALLEPVEAWASRTGGDPAELPTHSFGTLLGTLDASTEPLAPDDVSYLREAPLDPDLQECTCACGECDGTGEVECGECGHERDCETCGGDGGGQSCDACKARKLGVPAGVILGAEFDHRMVSTALAGLPAGEVTAAIACGTLVLRGGDRVALAAPLGEYHRYELTRRPVGGAS